MMMIVDQHSGFRLTVMVAHLEAERADRPDIDLRAQWLAGARSAAKLQVGDVEQRGAERAIDSRSRGEIGHAKPVENGNRLFRRKAAFQQQTGNTGRERPEDSIIE